MPAAKKMDGEPEKPIANNKRKRVAKVDYAEDLSDKENTGAKNTRTSRKRQATKATSTEEPEEIEPKKAEPKKTESKKVEPKRVESKKVEPKKADEAKEAKKLYANTLKAIEKEVKAFDERIMGVKGGPQPAVDTDDYAIATAKHLPVVEKLAAMDTVLAFNLIMYMAHASHTDLDSHPKMCGYGGSEPSFRKLDEAMLSLIEQRPVPKDCAKDLPEVRKRWTPEDADVGVFKTGHPNAQQRKEIDKQKFE